MKIALLLLCGSLLLTGCASNLSPEAQASIRANTIANLQAQQSANSQYWAQQNAASQESYQATADRVGRQQPVQLRGNASTFKYSAWGTDGKPTRIEYYDSRGRFLGSADIIY